MSTNTQDMKVILFYFVALIIIATFCSLSELGYTDIARGEDEQSEGESDGGGDEGKGRGGEGGKGEEEKDATSWLF